MKIFSYTNKGKRKINQDYILSRELGEGRSIHIVADGMGGYSKGEIAAELSAESTFKYITENNANESKSLIRDSLEYANKAIHKYKQEHSIYKMGTTIGGAYIHENRITLFWIGDVHIYYFRNNELLFESTDHSLLNELKKNNSLPEDWDVTRIKHVVSRSLNGDSRNNEPDFFEIESEEGDIIVVCSDGFNEAFDSSSFKKMFSPNLKPWIQKDDFNLNDDNVTILKILP